jgi:hypothetical protein
MQNINDILTNDKIMNFIYTEMRNRGFEGVKVNTSKKTDSVYFVFYNKSLVKVKDNSFRLLINNETIGTDALVKNRMGFIVRISDHNNQCDDKSKKIGINVIITPDYYEVYEQKILIARGQ